MTERRSGLFDSLSNKSRQQKLRLLEERFELSPATRILDVGGQADGGDEQFMNRHPHKSRITAANLVGGHLQAIQRKHPEIKACVADARQLPFKDNEFDIVFSNAVIEHVGSWKDQVAMANEVRRVARSWFITTPNRWFPFEFHLRLPFVSWLPGPTMMRVARRYSYSPLKGRYCSRPGLPLDSIRLLTPSEMRQLFPGSEVLKQRVTFMPETLVAIGGDLVV